MPFCLRVVRSRHNNGIGFIISQSRRRIITFFTYNHNDQAIEDRVEAAWDNENIITREAMGRNVFVPKAMYRLTQDSVS